MTRLTVITSLLIALVSGPALSAGGGDSGSGDAEAEAEAGDEMMAPHPVTMPGSYVALPDAFVTSVRNKILIARGEEPDGDHDDGGH